MNEQSKHNENDVKLEFKDIIAIMIAEFQILVPIILIGALVFALIFYVISKFWMKV